MVLMARIRAREIVARMHNRRTRKSALTGLGEGMSTRIKHVHPHRADARKERQEGERSQVG